MSVAIWFSLAVAMFGMGIFVQIEMSNLADSVTAILSAVFFGLFVLLSMFAVSDFNEGRDARSPQGRLTQRRRERDQETVRLVRRLKRMKGR